MNEPNGELPGQISTPDPAAAAAAEAAAAAAAAGPTDWREGLEPDLRSAQAVNDAADLPSFVKQHLDLQSYMGTALRIPSENADEAATAEFHRDLVAKVPGLMPKPDTTNNDTMNTFYDALGRPKSAEDYTRPEVEGMAPFDPNNALRVDADKAFAEAAHANGFNQQQFNGFYAAVMTHEVAAARAKAADTTAETQELRNELGAAFDGKMEAIAQVVEKFGGEAALVAAARAGTLPKSAFTLFNNIVEQLVGGGSMEIADQPGGATGVMTPAEADRQIQEIMDREEYRHHDPRVRQPWIDKVQELMKFAVPNALRGDDAVRDLRGGGGSG